MKRPILVILLILSVVLAASAFAAEKTKESQPKPQIIQSIETIMSGRILRSSDVDAVSVFISPVRLKFTISF